jgi:hypothetical protein
VLAGRILGAVNALVLECREERLGHRIVIADSGPAGRVPEAVFLQRHRELAGRVIAAAIGVEDRILGERVVAGRHLDSLLDERGLVVIVRGPPDHRLRVAVDDGGQEKPALPCRDLGDIADHFLAGRVSSEIPGHEIGNVVLLTVALGEADPPRPRLAGLQAQLAHQRPHQLRPGRHAERRDDTTV